MSIKRIFQLISTILVASIFLYLYFEYTNEKDTLLRYMNSESNLQATLAKNILAANADKQTSKILEAGKDNLAAMEMLQNYFANNGKNGSVSKAQQLLMQKFPNRHYDVFLIDSNFTIADSTYTRDIGLDFKNIPLAFRVLKQVYATQSFVDISPVYYDRFRNDYIQYVAQKAKGANFIIQFGLSFDDSNTKNLASEIKKAVPYLQESSVLAVPKAITDPFTYKYKYIDPSQFSDLKNKDKSTSHISSFEELVKHFTDMQVPKGTAGLNQFIDSLFAHSRVINFRETKDGVHLNTVIMAFESFQEFQFHERTLLVMVFDDSVYFKELDLLRTKAILMALLIGAILLFALYVIFKRVVWPMVLLYDSISKHTEFATCQLASQNDEVAKIVNAYNEMYSSLTTTISEKKELFENFKIFTSNSMHQIRTPISVMKVSQEALDDESSGEVKEQLHASIVMMEHISDNIEYRMQQNFLEFQPQIIDISDILTARIKLFSVVANANDKKIIANIENGIKVMMNKTELEYLIDNNISNAIKYGTVQKPISISLLKQSKYATLRFENEGKPIKNANDIFERYHRENNEKKGFGIGLHIVKEIADKFDISVSVECMGGVNTFCYIVKCFD